MQRIATGAKLAPAQETVEDREEAALKAEEAKILRNLREKRIREMQAACSAPVFGEVREVNASEFLDAIEKEDPRVFVVAHIYEETEKCCRTMNRCIESLARIQSGVKFLRMRASEAPQDFDPVTLPVLVVYRAGDLHASFVRCIDDIGENFTTDEVEWLLSGKGIFDQVSQGSSQLTEADVISMRLSALHSTLDDEEEDDSDFEN